MSNRKSFVFIYVVFMSNRFGQGSFDYPILKNVSNVIQTIVILHFGYFGYLIFAKNISVVASARIMPDCDLGYIGYRREEIRQGHIIREHITNHQFFHS